MRRKPLAQSADQAAQIAQVQQRLDIQTRTAGLWTPPCASLAAPGTAGRVGTGTRLDRRRCRGRTSPLELRIRDRRWLAYGHHEIAATYRP
jgi:hypothetical protein